MFKRIRRAPLIGALLSLRGNARACVYTEPLWSIPYNLFIPFFTLYMYSLGVKDAEIGALLSVGLFLQLFAALLGGVLTDKFGRRRTTFAVDFFAWGVPCVLWAFSRNFWWFFAAGAINSLWQITQNSWQCLMVEDADQRQLVHIYNWVYIAGLLAVFFAPLSGLFIARFSLIPVMRALLLFSAALMSLKFIILYRCSAETARGAERMRETKDKPLFKLTLEYGGVLKQALKSPGTVRALLLCTLSNITQLVSGNFFALYVTQNLGVPEQFLGFFPILRAAVMLAFFFLAQDRLAKFSLRAVMLSGLALYAAAQALLVGARPGALAPLVLYTGMDACAGALFLPRRDTMLINNVEPAERARVMSIIFTVMLGVSSPFGYIAGLMSGLDRRLPFLMNLALFALMGCVAGFERNE